MSKYSIEENEVVKNKELTCELFISITRRVIKLSGPLVISFFLQYSCTGFLSLVASSNIQKEHIGLYNYELL